MIHAYPVPAAGDGDGGEDSAQPLLLDLCERGVGEERLRKRQLVHDRKRSLARISRSARMRGSMRKILASTTAWYDAL